ncbi:integrating conjugative element protein, PFL_4695 family [Azotobacter beijerinckii]|uniref:Integrating conjugative element protein, PFL_4695 family n=1 Tax=Azotobacter beijerinckii TaxID=170623 RepID=A0A1H9IQV6_9GAMM|nr:integrating conjugative element protein [Azotobacter beijerinckii]SEJ27537.1 integrating conjugative element protein, PFL_4695 family [Azotobacter beijerinckii]SEQ77161.1 integrating conjugative element protein, PFL_4695 family [Azotobacter beijerinckii]
MLCCVLAGLLAACSSTEPERARQGERPKQVLSLAPWEAKMLPVVSRSLSPGPVASRAIDIPGLRPVFLIGDDSLSKSWLKLWKDKLRRLKALGLVVNVATPEGLLELRQLAEGLRLIPVTGDDLAGLLEFSHYPVLVTSTFLEQ